jgi:hypothetical protein
VVVKGQGLKRVASDGAGIVVGRRGRGRSHRDFSELLKEDGKVAVGIQA